MTQFCRKVQKPCFGAILGPFLPNFGQMIFFPKNQAVTFFTLVTPNFMQETGKTNEATLRTTAGRTDERTNERPDGHG